MSRLLIVNPFASGVDEHRLAAVQAALPAGTETRLTTSAGEATEIARTAGSVEAIYVLGGDGTYNEVLNGIQVDVPLGFLPGGGTSVLPRALGLRAIRSPRRSAWPRGVRGGSGSVASTGGASGSAPALASTPSSSGGSTSSGAAPTGVAPGTSPSCGSPPPSCANGHARFDEQVEIEGAGRAALVLVANCSPYTYSGSVALDLVPGASFDEGLAYWAPVTVRRAISRASSSTGCEEPA